MGRYSQFVFISLSTELYANAITIGIKDKRQKLKNKATNIWRLVFLFVPWVIHMSVYGCVFFFTIFILMLFTPVGLNHFQLHSEKKTFVFRHLYVDWFNFRYSHFLLSKSHHRFHFLVETFGLLKFFFRILKFHFFLFQGPKHQKCF